MIVNDIINKLEIPVIYVDNLCDHQNIKGYTTRPKSYMSVKEYNIFKNILNTNPYEFDYRLNDLLSHNIEYLCVNGKSLSTKNIDKNVLTKYKNVVEISISRNYCIKLIFTQTGSKWTLHIDTGNIYIAQVYMCVLQK